MKRQGMLAVVSGFSGAGKGTVMKALLEKYENYALSISATTRAPRPGEQDGREYFFMTDGQFEELIQNDRLIEHARYVNHYYGTPRSYVESKMAEGKDVILEIEIQGALNVKRQYPDLRGAAHSRRAEAEAGEPRNRDGGSDRQPFKTGSGGIRGNGVL